MTAALILAAGSIADEQGFDPTEKIGGVSPLRRQIAAFQQVGVERTVVITGYNAGKVERDCGHSDVIFLHNENYETGDMLSSVKLGLAYLKDKCRRVFISPIDVPFFTADTLLAMAAVTAAQVAIPVCGVEIGHPLLLSESAFDTVLEYDGPNGLKGVMSSNQISRQFVDVSDKGVLFNSRKSSGLDELLATIPSPKMGAGVKVWITNEDSCFGPGVFRLMTLVEETGSLKIASSQAGVSYSKACRVVAEVEKSLGYPIINSWSGGGKGGGSEVTEHGRELMQRYGAFMADCAQKVHESFEQHFGDTENLW